MSTESETPYEPKRDRLHLRLDAGTKRILERAASYAHQSVSEFVVNHAREAAEAVVAGNEQCVLDAATWDVFLGAIEDSPEPSPALLAAVAAYVARSVDA